MVRYDHPVMPIVKQKSREFGHAGQRFGGNADVGLAGQQHRGDLGRTGLVERHVNLGKGGLESADHRR
jgi:hypothetical protein